MPPAKPSRPPPIPTAFDDSDKTQVKKPPEWSDDGEKTEVLDKSQPGWDDEGETTTVIDKTGADALLDAAARVTGAPTARRPSSPAPRPAAGSPPTAAVTVIVQDHTSPALRIKRPAPWVIAVTWLWGSPTARARRVGLVAGLAGLFVGVALYAARAKRPPTRAAPPPVMEVRPDRVPVVAKTVAEPEPRGIDPSTLPRDTSAIGARERLKAPASPPPSEAPPPTVSDPVVPVDPADMESPYAHALPKASPKAPSAPAKSRHSAPPVAPAPATPRAAPAAPAGCAQPFTVDDHGIRRIKPECL